MSLPAGSFRSFGWIRVEEREGKILIRENPSLVPFRFFSTAYFSFSPVAGLVFLVAQLKAYPSLPRASIEVLALPPLLVAGLAAFALIRLSNLVANPMIVYIEQQIVMRGQRMLFSGPFIGADVRARHMRDNVTYDVRLRTEGDSYTVGRDLMITQAEELANYLCGTVVRSFPE